MKFLFSVDSKVSYERRKQRLGQEPKLIWLTGLSSSGKSTLAVGLERYLFESGFQVYLLDGDNVRSGINKDLGFSPADRTENIRRIAEVSKLMLDAGLIIVSAFISPFRDDRKMVREITGEDRFAEVFIDCPLEVCEKRDTKGLYKKARHGFIRDFTGIGSPYEIPENPSIVLHTDQETIEESLSKLIKHVENKLFVESL